MNPLVDDNTSETRVGRGRESREWNRYIIFYQFFSIIAMFLLLTLTTTDCTKMAKQDVTTSVEDHEARELVKQRIKRLKMSLTLPNQL